MKKVILLVVALAVVAGCSFKSGKTPEKYQSTFKGVPYAELTKFDKGGPPSGK